MRITITTTTIVTTITNHQMLSAMKNEKDKVMKKIDQQQQYKGKGTINIKQKEKVMEQSRE